MRDMREGKMLLGRVYRSSQRVFECKLTESGERVQARAKANLLKKEGGVVVGDYVELEQIGEQEWQITSVERRKSEIFRLLRRENRKKVVAANCDLLVIMVSLNQPKYKRGLIDRFLLRSAQWGIPAIVVFNKIDLFDKKICDLQFEADRIGQLTNAVFATCAKDADYQPQILISGPHDLKQYLSGKTAIFLGQSGVGKSKIITLLTSGRVKLLSGEIGKLGKGAHTTTWSELVECDDFVMIDSPGNRSFPIEDIRREELDSLFPDLIEIMSKCKFSNCSHGANAKGCFFYERLDLADYKTKIILSRLESYIKFSLELEKVPRWEKKHLFG